MANKPTKTPSFEPYLLQVTSGWGGLWRRLLIGALAGFTAAVAKYYTHNHEFIMSLVETEQHVRVPLLLTGYAIGACVLLFLGAITAWISNDNDIRRLFFLGLSAPSFLAIIIPAQSPEVRPALRSKGVGIEYFMPISTAYAQDRSEAACIGDNAFAKGLKVFFGVQERYDKYRVIVGSFKNQSDAAAKAKAINAEDPSFKAVVGQRLCDNNYYPVVVGDYLPLQEAKQLMLRAEKLNSVPEAYLSPGPR